jgi:hypothetical protein
MNNSLPTEEEEPRVPLVDLLGDPAALQKQLYKDALLALEAIRNEIAENGFLNTQKTQAFVSLTKLVSKMLEEQKETQRPDPLQDLMSSLPFHDEGIDPIIELPTGR